MLPFTRAQFLDVLEFYNDAIWPVQPAFYAASALALALVALRSRHAGAFTMGLLALMWVFNGAVYHARFFSDINPVAPVLAGIFIVQALAFAWAGFGRAGARLAMRADAVTAIALALVLYAAVGYPVAGALLGHVYPVAAIMGVAPCPTTVFTLGMLLLAGRSVSKWLYAIPLGAALFGSTALLFGMFEDAGLLVAGIAAAYLLVTRKRIDAHMAAHPA